MRTMFAPLFAALLMMATNGSLAAGASEEPQVQAHCGEVPIKRFGYCWVLGAPPDLLDDVSLQIGNAAPRVKMPLKNSRQITRNYLGVTTSRMPRSTATDYLPLESIHLIDGDVQTCWMSRGQTQADVHFCEMYFPQFGVLDLSLLRRSFDADPISPLQPQAAYYVTRNLATMLDGFEPGDAKYAVDRAPPNLESFALETPDGDALALWLGGRAQDHCEGVSVDVHLPASCRMAVACDPMNGTTQELVVARSDGKALIRDVLVRDWPLVIRWSDR